jgi:hypothetical protein
MFSLLTKLVSVVRLKQHDVWYEDVTQNYFLATVIRCAEHVDRVGQTRLYRSLVDKLLANKNLEDREEIE